MFCWGEEGGSLLITEYTQILSQNNLVSIGGPMDRIMGATIIKLDDVKPMFKHQIS